MDEEKQSRSRTSSTESSYFELAFPPAEACTPSKEYFSETPGNSNGFVSEKLEIVRVVHGFNKHERSGLIEAGNNYYTLERVKFSIYGADQRSICDNKWSFDELYEFRRIVRFERCQIKNNLEVYCTVGALSQSSPPRGVTHDGNPYIEISCLMGQQHTELTENDNNIKFRMEDASMMYYITSVDVLKIIEFLIDSTGETSSAERRKERSRIRSNLFQYWKKYPLKSKTETPVPNSTLKTNAELRLELAQRVMNYTYKKPRGVDKEFRVMLWSNLMPALKRALSCYYVKIPRIPEPAYSQS